MSIKSIFFEERHRYGLALSGGGTRGVAHIGVLKALEEHDIKPSVIAGVSAGSIVSVLYADGRTPDEIIDILDGVKFSDFAELVVPKEGFFSFDRFHDFLKKTLRAKRYEDLRIPTYVCATDIDHGVYKVFSEGPIVDSVVASCSMPIIFKPVKIDGVNYVDGGVLHNLPAEVIRKKCKHLIGVNCSPLANHPFKKSIIEIAQRSFDIISKTNTLNDMKLCDTLIVTNSIARHKVFDATDLRKVCDIGYRSACEVLENMKR